MDVFYYWKDLVTDVKSGRVGRFRSAKERLEELQAGCPSYIWAFKTPPGRKGELQLFARMVWSDKPLVAFVPMAGDTHIFYDPDHPHSVWFDGSDSDRAIAEVTRWVRGHIPVAHASNFQGMNGQHAMRGAVVADLQKLSASLGKRPFRQGIGTAA
ncbi:hypothetical protein [Piscinibacter sakaiensis]|uniref:hypothetical protein n=1 Tax=Piscinibacter sakaiensis TaxID=1547922 RepID=UPI003AB0F8FD